MDPLAALLRERPPQQLSVTELRSVMTELRARIALLEDTARAYRTELESRAWDALPDEIHQVIFGQLCSALDPRFWRVMLACSVHAPHTSDAIA